MNLTKYIFITVFILAVSWSCSQEEGFGGNSNIKGVLVEKYYNEDFTVFQYERTAQDEDIFIHFGEDDLVGEKTATSYNGSFGFNYLWPGDYNLYYYSLDSVYSSSLNEKKEIITPISLAKNETKNLGTIYAYKTLKWDEGSAQIKGNVVLINYKDNDKKFPNLDLDDVSPAQEQDVYITYNNAEFYSDRIKTQDDGTFVFQNLIKGTYRIFVYSEDIVTEGTADIVKEYTVEITELNQQITLEEITIDKI